MTRIRTLLKQRTLLSVLLDRNWWLWSQVENHSMFASRSSFWPLVGKAYAVATHGTIIAIRTGRL